MKNLQIKPLKGLSKTAFLFLVMLAVSVPLFATDYYIAANGNDNNSGTAEHSPWRTIDKVNASMSKFRPGDRILFRRGDVFFGSLMIKKGGTAGAPIVVTSYGIGAKAEITGFTEVSNWENKGRNIWESKEKVSSLSNVGVVSVNNKNTAMGRWPNSKGPNTGYAVISSHNGLSSITSKDLSSSPNWKGATAVLRLRKFILTSADVNSHNGNSLGISFHKNSYDIPDGNGFFIQNHIETLDEDGEWYFNPKTKLFSIYSRSQPRNVRVSSVDFPIVISVSYVTVSDISVTGGNTYGINLIGSGNREVHIKSCSISLCGVAGIVTDQSYSTFENNDIRDINSDGIKVVRPNATIRNNRIRAINLLEGMGDFTYIGSGITVSLASNTLVEYNTIDSSGYKGISFSGNNVRIKNNVVNTFCFVREDGAGIYTGNNRSAGSVIEGNLVLNGIGAAKGTKDSTDNDVTGISIDDFGTGIAILNNTIAHVASIGIKLHKATNITLKGNTTYDNGNGSWSKGGLELLYNSNSPVRNVTIIENIFFAKNKNQYSFFASSPSTSDVKLIGNLDGNYYAKPIDPSSSIIVNRDIFSISSWITFLGKLDQKSKGEPKKISDSRELRFEYNTTGAAKTIRLDAKYIDVKNQIYNGSVTLPPYSSVILISDGKIERQSPDANAGEDQIVYFPKNVVQLKGSTTLPENEATFRWQKLEGPAEGVVSNPGDSETEVTSLSEGVYKFILRVTNSANQSAEDTVVVTVKPQSYELLPAIKPGEVEQGLDFKYYEEKDIYVLPDFTELVTVKTGVVNNFDISVSRRNREYLIEYTGFIEVKEDGKYTFYTRSDDGSKLFIDGTLVVDNDGRHGFQEKEGVIGLKAGFHEISVGFFQQLGEQGLEVSFAGPSIKKQPIPSSALYKLSSDMLRPAVNPDNLVQGLNYNYYEGDSYQVMPDFNSLKPKAVGVTQNFDLSVARRDQRFAIDYTGYIEIPDDGNYTFFTSSDDGSILYVDGIKVVDNDGLHSLTEVSGKIGLKAGKHAIRVSFFQQDYNKTLDVSYSGPGIAKQQIDNNQLFREVSSELLPSINPANLVSGLTYKYAESSNFTKVPDFKVIGAQKTGITNNFDISVGNKDERFAVQFDGYIDIPEDGYYTFYTNSDDGSLLYINGSIVVDNDGRHPAKEQSGVVGLKKGKHLISVGFFQHEGGKTLSVSYSSNSFTKKLIPASALFRVDDDALLPSVNVSNTVNGLSYKYFESQSFEVLPDFSKLGPLKEGIVSDFDISVASRPTAFGMTFEGFIEIPTDGKYRFYTTSDDGSALYIDGKLVVDNDGLHASIEKSGEIGLKAGKHFITVAFFQSGGNKSLQVEYSGPGISKRTVPSSSLYVNSLAKYGFGQALASNGGSLNDPSAGLNVTKLKVYPNPFSSYVNVSLAGAAGSFEIEVVDVLGRRIVARSGQKNEGVYQERINLSSLQKGVYFVRVLQNGKATTVPVEKK